MGHLALAAYRAPAFDKSTLVNLCFSRFLQQSLGKLEFALYQKASSC
jgi:hypothetical protein